MKVECVSKVARDLPSELVRPELGLGKDRVFSLVVGKQYVVYGITCYLGHLWYYICDEDDLFYPVWKPSPLFKIVDSRLSSFWRIGMYTVASREVGVPIIAFDEWVSDPLFYDKLTDVDKNAVSVFKKYKQLMDEEFDS